MGMNGNKVITPPGVEPPPLTPQQLLSEIFARKEEYEQVIVISTDKQGMLSIAQVTRDPAETNMMLDIAKTHTLNRALQG